MPAPANLIHETSTTTGTGNFALSEVNGKIRFSDSTYGFDTGSTTDVADYFISNRDAAEWEIGTGHIATGTNTLVRDTVIFSSNSNAAVDFSAGTKDITNDVPAGRQFLVDTSNGYTAAQQSQGRSNLSAPLKGHIYGLTLSNNSTDATNDIDITVGEAASTETNPVLMVLSSALTKRLDAAWAVGTGNGGLDTGTIANTTYHVWLIRRSDTGVVDALFSTSASSPTMPSNYDQKRRIGSIVRSGAAIVTFSQSGDEFLLTPASAWSNQNPGTTAITQGLSVPAGIQVDALVNASILEATAAATRIMLVSSLSVANTAPSTTINTVRLVGITGHDEVDSASVRVRTDTSGQIRYRLSSSGPGTLSRGTLLGWVDYRGKLA